METTDTPRKTAPGARTGVYGITVSAIERARIIRAAETAKPGHRHTHTVRQVVLEWVAATLSEDGGGSGRRTKPHRYDASRFPGDTKHGSG